MISKVSDAPVLRPVNLDESRERRNRLDCKSDSVHQDHDIVTIETTESTSTLEVVSDPRPLSHAPATWSDNVDLWPGRSQIQEVAHGVCITNFFGARKIPLLQAQKITHIVICANELPEAFPLRFHYLKLDGFTDNSGTNLLQQLDIALPWIERSVAEGGRVLLHCAAGSSRSGSIMVAYLMRYQKLSLKDALEIARKERPIIQPNPGFMDQLEAFSAQCK